MTIESSIILTKDVSVASCTFAQLINSCNVAIPETTIEGQLCIPEYQRPYVWKEKQINRLLDDLLEYNKYLVPDQPMFYLGSIILHQDGGKLKIIDGQQRITTLLLMYAMINPGFHSGIQYTAPKSIENIRSNYLYLKSILNKKVFEYADLKLEELLDLTQINITLVITATEDLAYTFFETQNTGGVRLTGSDIIKAHHLRAVPTKKLINYQAKRWESHPNDKVEAMLQNLTKLRFWDNRNWRPFPLFRDKKGIKDSLISEFTEHTKKDQQDVSFYYSAVKTVNGRSFQIHESDFKQLKQPLSDGGNTLDYINDYVQLYNLLFIEKAGDHRISDSFYEMISKLTQGNSGSIFLREFFEICVIAYVSRFGFFRLFEASLWLYRAVYSLRVTSDRNVREASVFKFASERQFLNNILDVYTVEELFHNLKKFKYQFNRNNAVPYKSKDRHLSTLKEYFQEFKEIQITDITESSYDLILLTAIQNTLAITHD